MSKQDKHLYEFGPFRLDTSERLLLGRDGVRVPLTEKAFETLTVLVRRSGHLVSKEELMAEVWRDVVVEENNLDKSISAIRQALGEKVSEPRYVETVRGRGYRFVARVSEVQDQRVEPVVESGSQRVLASEVAEAEKETGSPIAYAAVEQAIEAQRPTVKPLVKSGSGKSTSLILLGAVIALGLSIGAYVFLTGRAKRPEKTVAVRSVAVLPFKPLASGTRDETLELGIADTLITRLSVVREMIVRPTSAVRRYTELEQDPVAAGRELGVEAVLDGHIQRVGERVRVTVRLMRIADGGTMWADKFDERFTDIFFVQDSISEQVVRSLALRLSGEEKRQLAKRDTQNAEAYELYLKGRYFWSKRTEEGLRKGIEYFRQAVALDANYASAYSGLADSYSLLSNYANVAPQESFPQAKEAALRALELDDTLAEAHTSLGRIKEVFEWDYTGTEREYRRALDLNPNYAFAHHRFGLFLCMMGRFDEGLAELERARQLDPLSLIINADIGLAYYFARRYDQSVDQLLKTIEMDSNFAPARYYLAETYVQKRMFDEAIAEAQKASELTGGRSGAVLSYSYAAAGRKDEAREVLKELRARAWVFQTIALAATYAELGETDEAFERLEKGYEQRAYAMRRLRVDPSVDGLRSDPRFQDLLRRIGLAQ